jgi:hypothetical protein
VNVRRALLAFGVGTGLAGLALAVFPGLAAGMGADRLFVLFVGVVAGVQAVLDLRARGRTRLRQAETGDPEAVFAPPRPGADVDAALSATGRGRDRYSRGHREEVRDRVWAAAVEALSRREDCSRDEAEVLLDRGAWTDDPYAAAFFGASVDADLPLGVRLRDALSPETRFSRRARHAIDELAEVTDG